jgi:hypothetical protein
MKDREPDASRTSPPGSVAPDEELVLDVGEVAPRCLALIDRVRRTGEEVLIVHGGRPVARLKPMGALDDEEDEDLPDWDLEAIGP